jgi:uncharacterized protein (DUF1810 family)
MANLQRFLNAQEKDYAVALAEVKNGKKRSHWIWYIFPQIKGLGFSATSTYYSIENTAEAVEFLQHPILGARLIDICRELLKIEHNNAIRIFGSPDDIKLRSSMTLFAALPGTDPVFQTVLDKFFNGDKDARTLQMMN